ncbi:hypothetical protein Q9R46_18605 [Paenibacillus sp. RRE4]|nr:hypothetical protein [Paenibacillus sp. RRE4]MDT0124680.1 hypothetical protein [Paenibacillus sp. RRE4]
MQYRYNGDGLLYERIGQGGATTRYYMTIISCWWQKAQ